MVIAMVWLNDVFDVCFLSLHRIFTKPKIEEWNKLLFFLCRYEEKNEFNFENWNPFLSI